MPHKVSTTNKEEADRTGKEYLSDKFIESIKVFKKIEVNRCKYCRRVLPENPLNTYGQKNEYCDKWCYEMENPPVIKHLCKVCNLPSDPVMRKSKYKNSKKINRSGVYKKICDVCRHKYGIITKPTNKTLSLIKEDRLKHEI